MKLDANLDGQNLARGVNFVDPAGSQHLATKNYVDTQIALTVLLAGRAGGQTIIGDTAASGNLTLQSTSGTPKGKILFGTSAYDERNNRLGVGTASPTQPFHAATNALLAAHSAFGPNATPQTNFTVEVSETITNTTGDYRLLDVSQIIDAATAVSNSSTSRAMYAALSTGNNSTAFTGGLYGLQFAVNHDSTTANVNIAALTGILGQAMLGNSGGVGQTVTATSMIGAQFQVTNRSAQSGTAVSGSMIGCYNLIQNVGPGTVAKMAATNSEFSHLDGGSGAGTTTLMLGFDLSYSFFTGGTITTAIGLRLQAWPAGPTYTNGPYGLSIEGSGSLNWIQGNTQIGGGSRPTSISQLLYVPGSAKFGAATTDTIGFHSATPVAQDATVAAATAAGAGYLQATATTWVTAINAIRTCLRNHGLMA